MRRDRGAGGTAPDALPVGIAGRYQGWETAGVSRATLPCPSMFGKADATVTGVLVDVGGRCVARGLICDDGLWFSVKPDG